MKKEYLEPDFDIIRLLVTEDILTISSDPENREIDFGEFDDFPDSDGFEI